MALVRSIFMTVAPAQAILHMIHVAKVNQIS